MVVGTAGSVSTGAVDPIRELAEICQEHGLWFHVDGAYGAPAAVLARRARRPARARAGRLAGGGSAQVAVRPARGRVRAGAGARSGWARPSATRPPYYRFDTEGEEPPINYYELGLQNSRGFRALKVWLGLRQAGREGYVRMIGDDCRLAASLHRHVGAHPELEAATLGLSIATFRYVPRDLRGAGAAERVSQRAERGAARPAQDGRRAVRDQRRASTAASCSAPASSTSAPPRPTSRRSPRSSPRAGRVVDAELRRGRTD